MFGWLFRRGGGDAGRARASREDVRQALERIVAIAPQVRLAKRYESRLALGLGKTLGHARELAAALPGPRDATPGRWASDPHLRAKFATPEDVARVIGESHELRRWFDEHIAADHAFALLGSTLDERRVLVAAQEVSMMRSDVARTAIGFDDKRLSFCSETDAALRQEIVQRIVEQFALEAMSRVAAQEARRDALREHRALITARMHMLERRGAGMGSLLASADISGDAARLQRDFQENEAALAALGSLTDAIEMQLRTMVELLAEPSALISVTPRTLRINQMNLLLDEGSDEHHAEIALSLAHIPTRPPQTRAVEIVRIARHDVPPAGTAFEDAARLVL
ncbi:hypothetical protein AWB83_02960 [Caballeronia ptereochthonis]|uniref:Uncharacterized protein n=2 Tax=Caballeronia ptereochthonis TaxID=1777144 RepID=A0A158BAF0_9BURK|nr:hypothetical protein AWB83_02960 [Caballeronia ptereochthonis]